VSEVCKTGCLELGVIYDWMLALSIGTRRVSTMACVIPQPAAPSVNTEADRRHPPLSAIHASSICVLPASTFRLASASMDLTFRRNTPPSNTESKHDHGELLLGGCLSSSRHEQSYDRALVSFYSWYCPQLKSIVGI
jgi:hypothetical protein